VVSSYLLVLQELKYATYLQDIYYSQLVTTDIEVGYNSVATLARPQIDNGSANVAVASRRELDDTIEFSAYVPQLLKADVAYEVLVGITDSLYSLQETGQPLWQ
jgi:hypothetical protein